MIFFFNSPFREKSMVSICVFAVSFVEIFLSFLPRSTCMKVPEERW